jgi:hypothetical protein
MGLTHQQIEERSILLHRAVAQKIRENPGLLAAARDNLRRWIGQGGPRPYWAEWEALLDGPLGDLLIFMVSPSEDARRLRQCSPFAGILTPRERWSIYESFAA